MLPTAALTSPAQTMNAYATWAVERWLPATLTGIDPTLASEIVMVMGLGGEAGEVVDLIDQWMESGSCDRPALVKELGDVIYYWARTMREFDLDAGKIFEAGTQAEPPSPRPLATRVMKLVVAQGRVLEAHKKKIRDGVLNEAKFASAMNDVAVAWIALCIDLGFDWQDILDASRDKMEGRTVRGTLRGSGDER